MSLKYDTLGCSLQVRGETLPLVEVHKNLGILFTSDGKREHEIEKWIRSATVVL